ncbi:MAG: polyprenyl synthetase family protein, partial [Haloquadratum sp.]
MSSDAAEERVLEAVRSRRELVNEALDEDVPMGEPERLYEASRYLLKAGGKRLRPTVSLLTAEALADVEPLSVDYRAFPALCGAEIDVMSAATSIEVIQSFTLIHDDIMDDDDLRRGVPAVHKEYDTETAILAGDTLYAKAFELLSEV